MILTLLNLCWLSGWTSTIFFERFPQELNYDGFLPYCPYVIMDCSILVQTNQAMCGFWCGVPSWLWHSDIWVKQAMEELCSSGASLASCEVLCCFNDWPWNSSQRWCSILFILSWCCWCCRYWSGDVARICCLHVVRDCFWTELLLCYVSFILI